MSNILDELKAIEERDGILRPQAVVEFARDPGTALHTQFEWNDGKAGEQYRVWQARQLIRVQVTYLGQEQTEAPAFISLVVDRYSEGGYRSIAHVLTDEELRDKMLADAKRDLETFRRKYQGLVELTRVFKELDRVFA